MSSELVVAAVQMTSVDDVTTNVAQMEELLKEAFKSAQPRFVSFPENCLYLRLKEGEKIEGLTLSHPAFARLSELAKHYNTYLHLGSIPLYLEGHLYNSSTLITPEGEVQPTYQKMHLFDIQLEGQEPIRESDVFRHGQTPNVIDIDGWKVGEAICYDVRFAELFSQYARREVDVILLPAAFLVKTGEAHWEILLRARAIENQSYVIAAAQGGTHTGLRGGVRETYGHSLIIDPWGAVVGQVEKRQPGVTISKFTRERIDSVRRQIPMKFHRRLPVG
ncbi:Deaminated glutathione amidase [Bdellovibrio bacteriovorus]|uniref:carbon-nitrogen hydrolase family protein n=1 Tax=Bdellovibrio bacteriovorus TaxID=959 RepID=UPI00045C18C5|nr:carbon-nitrogen hydrolase family protein [Bdellovibrio bacteriovorus]AHZ86199.1 amidohydrolase [Bdellovibrio bacteriovorus]BEV67435.1 Deaminated glutathione amidase [Bdellovibrio bacteriovorus]